MLLVWNSGQLQYLRGPSRPWDVSQRLRRRGLPGWCYMSSLLPQLVFETSSDSSRVLKHAFLGHLKCLSSLCL